MAASYRGPELLNSLPLSSEFGTPPISAGMNCFLLPKRTKPEWSSRTGRDVCLGSSLVRRCGWT